MTTYQLPPEPDGPLWDERDVKFYKDPPVGFSDMEKWTCGPEADNYSWRELVFVFGPLTDVRPPKVGDKITAEQAFELPKESVIWPDLTPSRGAWTKRNEGELDSSTALAKDAGELKCMCGDEFTILRIGETSETINFL